MTKQNKPEDIPKPSDDYIWSEVAIRYSAGLVITDNQTGNTYTDAEAHLQPPEIRRRLTLVPNEIGTWVKK